MDQKGDRSESVGPLAGVRVVEMTNTFAGPACGRLLADFGADVIKLEPLEGDPVRQMGAFYQGVSLQAASIQRGKRSLALNMKSEEGAAIFRDLVAKADVLLENSRPGVLERLGFDEPGLRALNRGLVFVRISGYGQTGPYRLRPGYGAICDAYAGVRDLTGDPDRPPSRVALATTDYLTAVYAAFGTMMALYHRQRTGEGQLVDAALYEAAFSMMEGHVPAFEKLGVLPRRQGASLPNVAPNNLYRTTDSYILIAANNDSTFARLTQVMGQPDMPNNPDFCTVRMRGQNAKALDALIEAWTVQRDAGEIEALLHAAEVPAARVQTLTEVFDDAHFQARDMLLQVAHPVLGTMTQIGVVPKLSKSPGRVRSAGPEIGEDTSAILRDELGMSDDRIATLLARGVVGQFGTVR